MNKNLKSILVAAMMASFAATAHDPSNGLVDASGAAVKNNFGQCVEVTTNPALAECGVATPQEVVDVEFSIGAHALFDTAKSNLRSAGKSELNALAAKINEKRELGRIKSVTGVKVVGHTDSRGSVAYNQGLSERRAASVRNYLVQLGVPASIISAYGEGEMNPIATNKTAAGRQENRRVNITITGLAAEKK